MKKQNLCQYMGTNAFRGSGQESGSTKMLTVCTKAMMVTIATKWTLDTFKSTHQHDTENN